MSNDEKTVMFALPNMMSGQLACVAGSAAGRSWDLSAGTFTIGRLDEHDMSLPQEPGISKLHAKIIGQGDRYLITDCESRNGTLLNGQLIQRADLYDGDEIRICGCVLRFTQKGGPARPRPRPTEPAPSLTPSPEMSAAPPSIAPAPMMVSPMIIPAAAPAPSGKTLAVWYAAGLFGSLLLGGAASAALLVRAPEPPIPLVAEVMPTDVPTAPVVADAGVAAAEVAAVDAGVVAADVVEAVAVAEASVATPDSVDELLDLDVADTPKRPTSTSTPTSPTPTSKAASGTYPAVADGVRSETLRSKTGGRVRSVEAKDGTQIVKGTILVTFETGADGDEVATLQDRIASLETVEGEEAKRDLKTARARLSAIESSAKSTPITAGIDGTLTAFNVSAGTLLKAGETVGRIVDGEVSTRVKVTVRRGVVVKNGEKVSLTLKAGGSGEGTVVAVSGRVVVIDTGSEAGDGVESVTF